MSEVKDEVRQKKSFKEENLIYLVYSDGACSEVEEKKPESVNLFLEKGTYTIGNNSKEYEINVYNHYVLRMPGNVFGVYDRTSIEGLREAMINYLMAGL